MMENLRRVSSFGIANSDLAQYITITEQGKAVIIFRPTSEVAGELKASGEFYSKPMQTKGKSTEFPPSANGLVPHLACLSSKTEAKDLDYYQGLNDSDLGSSEQQKAIDIEIAAKFNEMAGDSFEKKLQNFNQQFPQPINKITDLLDRRYTSKITHQVDFEGTKHDLLFFKDIKENPIRDDQGRPIFGIATGENIEGNSSDFKFLNLETNTFENPNEAINAALGGSFTSAKFEVLANCGYQKIKDGTLALSETLPLTADNDLWSYGQQNLTPISQNNSRFVELEKQAIQDINRSPLGNILSSSNTIKARDLPKRYAELLFKIEQEERQVHTSETAGSLSGASSMFVFTAKYSTAGAVSHGAECDNDEKLSPLTDGDYVVIEEGRMRVANTVKALITEVNKLRKSGFLVKINPKWPVEYHEGSLRLIDESQRTNWEEIQKIVARSLNINPEKQLLDKYLEIRALEVAPKTVFRDLDEVISGNKTSLDRSFFEEVAAKTDQLRDKRISDLKKEIFEEAAKMPAGNLPHVLDSALNPKLSAEHIQFLAESQNASSQTSMASGLPSQNRMGMGIGGEETPSTSPTANASLCAKFVACLTALSSSGNQTP